MSEIRANTVSNAAGTGPVTLTGQSAAKAWVNFNGEGTIAARDSFNLSSLTDLGEGRYRTTIANSMSGTNYMVLATAGNEQSDYAEQGNDYDHLAFLGERTTSTQAVFSADHDDGIQDDCQAMNLAVFGDLA